MVVGTVLTLVLAVTGVIIYYGYSIVHFANSISTVTSASSSNDGSDKDENSNASLVQIPKWEGQERVNILLIGGDSRGDDAGRSDSVMVASIDPVSKKLFCSPCCVTPMLIFRAIAKAVLTPLSPTEEPN